jgi:hypothetical protein
VRLAPLLAALLALSATSAYAQKVDVRVSQGPHYVGERIVVVVTAADFEEEPTPDIEAPRTGRGQLQLQNVNPEVSTSITIQGGRVRQQRRVSFSYRYSYLTHEPGEVRLGPFRVTQGTRGAATRPVALRVQDLASSSAMAVELEVPESPVFVGERVPVTVRFFLSSSLRENLQSYDLQVPLFDASQSFRFLDEEDAATDTEVTIDTATGPLALRGRVREVRRHGQPFVEVAVTRTLVPLRSAQHELPASSLIVDEGTRWRRDLFGRRQAVRTRKLRVQDRLRRLVVRDLPAEGRPASFAGAVGAGFTLEVQADRTVVQIGDPITLTLLLRGEGLETASLPPLDAEGLLAAERFRVPGGELTGTLTDDGAKRFTAVVRVLDERVPEIPALAYSWFDPTTGSYQTTRSRPIALAVRWAEIIGAADVESEEPPLVTVRTPAVEPSRVAAPHARSLALSGADLAIERDPARLLRSTGGGWGARWQTGGLYALALVVVGAAWLDRRRRDVDPGLTRRKRNLEANLRRVEAASGLGAREAAAEVAGALRSMLAEAPEARAPEFDDFLGDCDARRYAPSGTELARDDAFCARAREIALHIAGCAR